MQRRGEGDITKEKRKHRKSPTISDHQRVLKRKEERKTSLLGEEKGKPSMVY